MNMTPQMTIKWGGLPHLRYVGNSTWHSACPKCGEIGHDSSTGLPDRFFIQSAKNGHDPHGICRRCGLVDWLDSDTGKMTAAELKQLQEASKSLRIQYESEREATLKTFQRNNLWKQYHDRMTPLEREFWLNVGIPESLQDFWGVGYVDQKKYKIGDTLYQSPALSIPYFNEEWIAENLQFRLLESAVKGDHYRWTYGLEPVMWRALPDEAIKGRVLVCEGFKKGAVTFTKLVATGNAKLTVVAVPNKTPNQEMMDKLMGADEVLICLDPDAYKLQRKEKVIRAKVVAKMLPDGLGRLVHLPAKIDDLLVEYGWSHSDIERSIDMARLP